MPKAIINIHRSWLLCMAALLCVAGRANAQDLEKDFDPKHPVKCRGAIDLRSIMYTVDGIPARRPPFSYLLTGNAEANVYGVALPFSFTISDQQRDVRQPFNQFGISPKYKWVQVHLGYRNVVFSPYTLAGYTMLGYGIELTPGKFRFGFMNGRLNKATSIDTTTGTIRPYSFSRTGYAAKLGYGTEEKNVELSYLSARDDSNSINTNIPDTLRTIAPAANVVFSIRSLYTIKKRFYIEVDGGASVYTNNIASRLGVFNKEVTNLTDDERRLLNFGSSFITLNATSQINLAYSASIGYKAKQWSVKAMYKRIDPEFQSMGAYFFQNDIENYTLGATLNTLKNKLRLAGSFGAQNDNLRQQKTAKTTRLIGSANISYDITEKFGIDANYINFSANATPSIVNVNNKYMLAQTTDNASVTPHYVLPKEKFTHVMVASYNMSTLQDRNAETSLYNNVNTEVIFLTYSITHNKTGLSVSAGLNKATTKFYSGMVNSTGGSLGVSKSFLETKLQTSLTCAYSLSDQGGSASVLSTAFTAEYNITRHHKFLLRYYMLNNTPQAATINNPAFTEHTAEAGYTYTF